MVDKGKKVKIKEVIGGEKLKKRLSELGVYNGTSIEIIKNDFSGPLILKVLDSKIVIGRGQAQKIIVMSK